MTGNQDSGYDAYLIAWRCGMFLADRTGGLGEHGVGIRSDQPNRADNNDENHSQHDSLFRDVLAFFSFESKAKVAHNTNSPLLTILVFCLRPREDLAGRVRMRRTATVRKPAVAAP